MKRLLLAIVFALVASADSGAQGCYGPGCGAGAVTITSGTTATSGCVAGGVLRSISNLVDCGAGLTYASGNLSIGFTGGTHPLSVRAGSNVGIMLLNAAQTYTLATIVPRGSAAPNTNKGYFTLHDSGTTPVVIDSAGSSYFEGGNTRFGGSSLGSTTVPLTARLGTGSTANVLEMQDSAGTVVGSFSSAGNLTLPSANGNVFHASGAGAANAQMRLTNTGGDVALGVDNSAGTGFGLNGGVAYSSVAASVGSDPFIIATNSSARVTFDASSFTTYFGNGITSATPSNATIIGTSGTGTNIAGGKLTIAAGAGTGSNATDGTIAFQTAPVLASGTTAQTPVDRVIIPKSGGLQLVTGTKPTCDSSTRGTQFYVAGGAGVADTIEFCAKSSLDAYAWYPMATIP